MILGKKFALWLVEWLKRLECLPSNCEALSSNPRTARYLWLTSIILATQEAEVKRITV
jgi:hypothetical protein